MAICGTAEAALSKPIYEIASVLTQPGITQLPFLPLAGYTVASGLMPQFEAQRHSRFI
jgi:hypothetical protein